MEFLSHLATKVASGIVSLFIALGLYAPPISVPVDLGAQNAVGGDVYYLSGSGVGATDTTMNLTKFGYKRPDGVYQTFVMSVFGDLGCGTIQPGVEGKQEFVSFTGITQNSNGTAQLTGVTRGLERSTPYSASTTLRTSHSGGSKFVISNSPPCFYESYANRTEDETISGQYIFSTNPIITGTATSGKQTATREYADSLTISGAPTSTESTMGVSSISSQGELANGTASTTAGAPKVIPSRLATSSPQSTAGFIPTTNSSGKIPSGFVATSSDYNFTGTFGIGTSTPSAGFAVQGNAFVSGTTTSGVLSATSSIVQFGTQPLKFNVSNTASSTLFTSDGAGGVSLNGETWGELLAASSTPIATSTMTLTIPARRDLRIIVDSPGSDNDGMILRFNLDNGSNYGSGWIGYTTTDRQVATRIVLGDENSSTTARYFDIRVKNQSTIAKRVDYSGTINSGTPATYAGKAVIGSGIWNNTSAQITSVSIQMGTLSNTFNANTSVSIYGSVD